jgi:hypothetical protein
MPPAMAKDRVRTDILFSLPDTNPKRAKIPPSPRLSASRMKMTYLTLTMMVNDQKMSDMTPKIFVGVKAMAWWPEKHSLMV